MFIDKNGTVIERIEIRFNKMPIKSKNDLSILASVEIDYSQLEFFTKHL